MDKPGTYVAQLIVNDGTVDSLPDTVTITTQNSRPVAKAGPDQTVLVGDTVTLDGSGSQDADGDPLTFFWSLTSPPAGSTATLSDPGAVKPTLVIDLPGTYVSQLIVNDGKIDSLPDTVVITTENSRPVANAGPDQTVLVGDTVTLDGSGSQDADEDPLTFFWSFTSLPAGSTATLSDPEAVKPTLVIDRPGTYVSQLIVNDGQVDGNPDTVTITTGNAAPVVNAGTDQTITLPANAILTGTVTDDGLPLGGSLTISWSKFSGPGAVTFSPPDAVFTTASFDAAGTYVLRLTGSDSALSASDDVQITVNSLPSQAPAIISAPVTSATAEQLYVYDVEATDPDAGDLLTFLLDAFPAGMTINASTGLIQWTPSAAQLGGHNVAVRVRDIAGLFALQSFTVQVNPPASGTPFFTSAPPTTAVAGRPIVTTPTPAILRGVPWFFHWTRLPMA